MSRGPPSIARAPTSPLGVSGTYPQQPGPPADPARRMDPLMEHLLLHMPRIRASDLYLTAGAPPVYRVDGRGYPAKDPLTAAQTAQLATALMTPAERAGFARGLELNLAVVVGATRFRINVFQQRGALGLVARLIPAVVPTLADLALPAVLGEIAMSPRGLVLVVGATGSGKSTTLAAMVDHRNATATGHIVTVEDPIEFVHAHQKCLVTQREVGEDTRSYAAALKSALRQAPDVILIGEVRDAATMEAALRFAETGHLCLSTLHANNANQAVERVLNFFPVERHGEVRLQLSLNLRAVVSQRLLPAYPSGRVAALEIMLDTPRVRELVKRGEIVELKAAMEQSATDGCCTFDSALLALHVQGRVNAAEALRAADSANDLRLRIERLGAGDVRDDAAPLRLRSDPPRP